MAQFAGTWSSVTARGIVARAGYGLYVLRRKRHGCLHVRGV